MDGKNVYLCGAMTGHDDWNAPAFEEAEERMFAQGAAYVFNPAASASFDHERDHSYYMTRDLHELTWHDANKTPFYDVIAVLPGWEQSQGACVEIQVAIACGIEVMHL